MKNTEWIQMAMLYKKQTSIIDYKHNKGGVDLADQQLESLDVLKKSYTWCKKLFLGLVRQYALATHELYKNGMGLPQ